MIKCINALGHALRLIYIISNYNMRMTDLHFYIIIFIFFKKTFSTMMTNMLRIIHFFVLFILFYAALETFSVIIYYLVTLYKKVPLVNIS